MSVWFTASAVSVPLSETWGLTPAEASWLTTVVQLGFVAGTGVAAVLNLADVVPARLYFSVSALLAAAANALLLAAPGFGSALALRFATGFLLAGVYPPAMKMVATWFRDARGLAIGTLVGALTVGKAGPYLLRAVGGASAAPVVVGASVGAALGGLLVLLLYRDGPHAFLRRPFALGLVGEVLRHRETRLAIGGYVGHMWELYAMWALVSLFLGDVLAASGAGGASMAALLGFFVIASGGVGAVVAGRWADLLGRERVTIASMAVSGVCSLGIGWMIGAPPWMVVAVALVWGFAIVADSAQFSAVVTEVAPRHAVGTALTLQTMLGFAVTALSIWLATVVAEAWGWGPAFALLAPGPVLGIASMVRLQRIRYPSPPARTTSGRLSAP